MNEEIKKLSARVRALEKWVANFTEAMEDTLDVEEAQKVLRDLAAGLIEATPLEEFEKELEQKELEQNKEEP